MESAELGAKLVGGLERALRARWSLGFSVGYHSVFGGAGVKFVDSGLRLSYRL